MRTVETNIVIAASTDRVWSVLTDFAAYPDWNPFLPLAEGVVAAGERLTIRIVPPGAKPMTFRPTVTVVAPGRELRWLGRLVLPGLFDGEHRFALEGGRRGNALPAERALLGGDRGADARVALRKDASRV